MSHAFSARVQLCAVALGVVGTSGLALASKASAHTFSVSTGGELVTAVEEANTSYASEGNRIELAAGSYNLKSPLKFTSTSARQEIVREGEYNGAPAATIEGSEPGGLIVAEPGVELWVKYTNLEAKGPGDPVFVDRPRGILKVRSDAVTSESGAGVEVQAGAYAEARNSSIGEGDIGVEDEGELLLKFSTVAYNKTGIEVPSGSHGTFTLEETIVAENKLGGDCRGAIASKSEYSLDSDGSCDVGKLSGVNPRLEALFPPGEKELTYDLGPAKLFTLKPKSPAIEATPICIANDARGQLRPAVGPNCSIGAEEYYANPPKWTVPANIKAEVLQPVEFDGVYGGVVTYAASASAEHNLILRESCTPPSGSVFPYGTTTVVCKATAGNGVEKEAEFKVTLYKPAEFIFHLAQVEHPILPGPGPVEAIPVNATVPTGAGPYSVTASDNVDGAIRVDCTPESGATFPIGQTLVTCSATDSGGFVTTVSFVVSVLGALEQLTSLENEVGTSAALTSSPGLRGLLLSYLRWAEVWAPGGVLPFQPLACNVTNAFVALVLEGTPRAIPVAVADEWVADGKRVEGVMGCPPPWWASQE